MEITQYWFSEKIIAHLNLLRIVLAVLPALPLPIIINKWVGRFPSIRIIEHSLAVPYLSPRKICLNLCYELSTC